MVELIPIKYAVLKSFYLFFCLIEFVNYIFLVSFIKTALYSLTVVNQ